jgi:nucleotide-binding universal stress UspA family protein
MIDIKTILVPVDFSEASRKAVKYGLTLAAQLKARLVLAYVLPTPTGLTYGMPPESYSWRKEQLDLAGRDLQKVIPAEIAKHYDVHTIVKTGEVEAVLLEIVETEKVGLVVMGTRGRRNLGRWFMGSVTEHLLRRLPVPVVTVSHVESDAKALDLGLVVLRNILYATDFSDESQIAFRYAVELAKTAGAHLTAVHVVDDLGFTDWGGHPSAFEAERKELVHRMEIRLREFVSREKHDMEIETLVIEGKPYREILSLTELRTMDMIVISLQGKSAIERALLGSTAERVVRQASVPVFSVPLNAPVAITRVA